MTFKNSDPDSQSEIIIIDRNEEFVEIELTCIVDSLSIKIEKQRLRCDNIDPEGMNSMDIFDPSGNFRSGLVYDNKNGSEIIRIFIPYEDEGSEVEYIGLSFIEVDGEEKTKFERVLE